MKVILSCYCVFPFHGKIGLYKYVYYLAKHLIQNGIEAEIVTSADQFGKRVEIYDGIKYVFLPPRLFGRRHVSIWRHMFNMSLATYLRGIEFDVLHSFADSLYIYLRQKSRKPTIIQPFGLEQFTAPSSIADKGMKKLYMSILVRHSLKYCITHADAVAMEGEFQFKDFIKFGIPEERLFILPVGVDVAFLKGQLEKRTVSRADLGLESNAPVLISVNNFQSDRGIGYLVDAFKVIKHRMANAKLILIGNARNKTESLQYQGIVNQIEDYGLSRDVLCLKNAPESLLYAYYNLADIYVSPTLLDDHLMSILEAMVCGLPIVSTGQEFVVKPGVNGYIVPKRDAEAMAEAVVSMHSRNEEKEMGARSQEIVKDYDLSLIAQKAIEKYDELMQKGRTE